MYKLVAVLALVTIAGCSAMMTGSGSGARSGPAIGSDSRTSSQSSADSELAAQVRRRLDAEASLQPATLRVTARSGVVTLSGKMSSFESRDRAVRLAGDVAGVRQVRNQLTVDTR